MPELKSWEWIMVSNAVYYAKQSGKIDYCDDEFEIVIKKVLKNSLNAHKKEKNNGKSNRASKASE